MTALRLVVVLPSFAGGGAERVAMTLLQNFDRTYVQPHLVVMDATGPLAGLVPADVPVTTLGVSRLRHAIPALRRALCDLRPDAVYSTIGYMNLALLALRPWLPMTASGRRPKVFVREANMPSQSLAAVPWPRLFRWGYRHLYRRADRVICTSAQMEAEFVRDFGLPADRLLRLPNPIAEQSLREVAAAQGPQRRPGPGLRLVAAGRLTRQKAFERLMPLMAALPADAHLTLLGDGPERSALETAAHAAGVAEKITFAGFCPQPHPLYAGADAVVMTSRWEGMPNVALEALACGTPVIATPEAGAIAEVAAAAPAGAVTLASAGEEMAAACAALIPGPMPEQMRPSLLPPAFRVEQTVKTLSDALTTTDVLHIITDLDVGGAETMLAALVASPDPRLRHRVVSLLPAGAIRPRIEAAGIPVTDLGMSRGLPSPVAVWRLVRLLRQTRPQVVQGWMYHADLVASLALALSGLRGQIRQCWGIRCSDMDPSRYGRVFRAVLAVSARWSAYPDAIIANSQAGLDSHLALGYRPRRQAVVWNGIDTTRFAPDPQARAELRAEWGIAAGERLFAHVARVDPMKDHALFLQAVDRLNTGRVVLVGKGTEALPPHPRVLALGVRADVPRILAAADVIVSSSAFGEGFPNVLAEGMACGCVPISTDVGDAAALMGPCGLAVPRQNVEALASALQQVAAWDEETFTARSRACRQRAEAHFTMAAALDGFLAVYKTL